ncbi:cache domain-containing protein [Celeribacter sp. PS-C1]|nr:cache domain-containing protein [Celeribacter sp. PS-C1]
MFTFRRNGAEMLRALLAKLSVRIYAIVLVSMIMILSLTQIIMSISYDTSFRMREQHLSDVIDTVASNLEMLEQEVQAGKLSREEAYAIARDRIMTLNYDEDGYFFAFEKSNRMIAHPTKPEWIGQDMSSYADTRGTNIFVAMTSLVKEQGRGTITYFFDKPNGKGDEEKISYVAEFQPWGWIIGTGSYLSDIQAQMAMMKKVGHGVELVTLALLLGVSTLLVRSVTKPLNAIKFRMSEMSDGDTTTPVPMTKSKSEIGEMARVLEVFRNALVEREELAHQQTLKDAELAQEREANLEREHLAQKREEQAEEQRRQDQEAARLEKERERALVEKEREQNLKEQQRVVESLATGLGAMSRGDLTVRIEEAFPTSYEKLRNDFNNAVEKVAHLAAAIAEGAVTIINETDNLNSASLDLSRRTETQAASLEEFAAAIAQLAASVESSAKSARHAAATVGQTKDRSVDGRNVVQRTVEAMNDIAESSTQISKITTVIDDIAFQTNLLALNAGVEAARAGESGRGFAVVASEVRALAQRSSEAANEIAKLIETSGRQVQEGVQLVNASGSALAEIESLVTNLDGLVQTIATSASEQSVGLSEITTAVSQLDQVTQHNAAMFEETTAALQALKAQATSLERDSAQLKTTQSGDELRLAS